MMSGSDVVVDDSICPTCQGTTYVGQTIACETCSRWFHFGCVGVTERDACVVQEDVPYYCPECTRRRAKIEAKKARKASSKASKANKLEAAAPQPQSPFKLKINFSKKEQQVQQQQSSRLPVAVSSSSSAEDDTNSSSSSAKRRRRQSEVEEERWLDAVEAGEDLDQIVDPELRSMKNPKLMTARQRAMTAAAPPEMDGHIALDFGSKKRAAGAAAVVGEMAERVRALKTARRKEVEAEKRELDKRKTMERLLKKKESSAGVKAKAHPAAARRPAAHAYTYTLSGSGASVHVPSGAPSPYERQPPREPPRPVQCAVSDCFNVKRFSCRKTGNPVCSMACYIKNLQAQA